MMPSFSTPKPGHLFLPGCAIAAGLLTVSLPSSAAPTPSSVAAPLNALVNGAQKMRVGETLTFPLSASVQVEEGGTKVLCNTEDEYLSIKALGTGQVKVRIAIEGQTPQLLTLDIAPRKAKKASDDLGKYIMRRESAQVVQRAPEPGAAPVAAPTTPVAPDTLPDFLRDIPAPTRGTGTPAPTGGTTAPAPATDTTAPAVDTTTPSPTGGTETPATPVAPTAVDTTAADTTAADTTAPVAPTNTTPFVDPTVPIVPSSGDGTSGLPALAPVETVPGGLPPQTLPPIDLTPQATLPGTPPPAVFPPDTLPPAANAAQTAPVVAPGVSAPAFQTPRIAPPVSRPVTTTSAGGARVLPNQPIPNRNPNAPYKTSPRIPANVKTNGSRSNVRVTKGLATLIQFPSNILSVFFSNPNVMDARAINARTIAATGVGAGESTLAVFTSRYPGDVLGQARIYRIQTTDSGATVAKADPRNTEELETAIESAIGDPRVRVSVNRLPDGSLSARLLGTVRNDAEVKGAVTTAGLYVPQGSVLSSLYADANAPSIDQVLSTAAPAPTTLDTLQDNLRRITGNNSVELIQLPTGLSLKAETNSPGEAEAILRLVPTLNQPVLPFIVVRGAATTESPYYNSTIPVLQGEDLQLTQKLQSVTGVRTVYVTRASGNSVAIYGNVRTRAEYETVKRYSFVVAQTSTPIPLQGSTQGGAVFRPQGGETSALAAYSPAGGYAQQLGVQMFVRITDPTQSAIRNVTVDTNIVEISRTALRNLGVEYGSATTLTETVTVDTAGNRVVNRTVDPTFNQGVVIGGNGFGGFGGFTQINPFRARLNALVTNGDARILSNPNVSAVEGMPAQITIGGERPVPAATATFGANAQSVEFRRFGVIITMRPTVNEDNTIILQIRADVTQPDPTYQINLNGAIIPGETVRSVDTTLTVRPGDMVVMGGLMSNEKRQQTSKVPVLGDLPVIGSLFRSRRFENNETELAIFMTPRLDFIPSTMNGIENLNRAPSFPALPGRQEQNQLFQNNARIPGQ